jgi:hypothetical protein
MVGLVYRFGTLALPVAAQPMATAQLTLLVAPSPRAQQVASRSAMVAAPVAVRKAAPAAAPAPPTGPVQVGEGAAVLRQAGVDVAL